MKLVHTKTCSRTNPTTPSSPTRLSFTAFGPEYQQTVFTSLQALQFAIDQAAFACEASPSPPDSLGTHGTGARDDPISHTTGAAAAVTKGTAVPAAGPAPYVRRAVRAALQFACNYCVGNEDNRASLWKRWFPRGLMVGGTLLVKVSFIICVCVLVDALIVQSFRVSSARA